MRNRIVTCTAIGLARSIGLLLILIGLSGFHVAYAQTVEFDPGNQDTVVEGNTLVLDIISTSGSGFCDVDVFTINGTATSPGDFVALSETVTIGSSASVTLETFGDLSVEGSENLTVNLAQPLFSDSSNEPCDIGGNSVATVTIEDLSPSTVEFTASTFSGTEGDTLLLDVIASTSGDISCDINIATSDGTATSPEDFTSQSTVLSFGATTSVLTFSIPLASDSVFEGGENFTVTLSPTGGGTIPSCFLGSTSSATVSVIDATAAPTAELVPSESVNFTNVYESQNAGMIIELTEGTGVCDVVYSSVDGTARAPADYRSFSGVVTLDSFGVLRIDPDTFIDELIEGPETMTVMLGPSLSSSNPSCQIGALSTATITIYDRVVEFVVPSSTVTEGSTGAALIELPSLGSPNSISCDVLVTTSDGTASSQSDYTPQSTVYTINSGSAQTTVPFDALTDALVEGSETFTLQLSQPTSGNTNPACDIGASSIHTVNIQDDAPELVAEITAATTAVSATEGTTATIEIALTSTSGLGTCDIDVTTEDGSAAEGNDYTAQSTTVTVQPSGNTQFTIPVLTDDLVEDSETFSVILSPSSASSEISNPACAVGSSDTAIVTIIDATEQTTVEFATNSINVDLIEGSNTLLDLAVTGTGECAYSIRTVDGTATSAQPDPDFIGRARDGEFSASVSTTFLVDALMDSLIEGPESYTVILTPRAGPVTPACQIGSADTATITITDVPPQPVVQWTAASRSSSGNEGSTVILDVELVSGSGPVTIEVSTADIDAADPADYIGFGTTIFEFPENATAGSTIQVPVQLVSDAQIEETETFIVSLALFGANSDMNTIVDTAIVSIIDVPVIPTVEFATNSISVTLVEGNEALLEVPVSIAGTGDCIYTITSVDGTATSAQPDPDFTSVSIGVSGFISDQTFRVDALVDSLTEGPESYTIILTSSAVQETPACQIGAADTATISITDLPPQPVVQWTAASISSSGDEGSTVTLDVELVSGSGPTTFGVFTSDVDATDPEDYVGFNTTTFEFPENATVGSTIQVSVPLASDALIEETETFNVVLEPLGANTNLNTVATVSIIDVPVAPTVEFASNSISVALIEGNDALLALAVTGTGECGYLITTVDGTATSAQPSPDFTSSASGFAGDPTGETFRVDALVDALTEGPESYTVTISPQAGDESPACQIGPADTATISITDVPPQPVVQWTAASISSSGSEGTTVTLDVELVSGNGPTTFGVFTSDVDAIDPEDYIGLNTTTFAFPDNATVGSTVQVSVPLVSDALVEETETFNVVLEPEGAETNQASVATVSIIDVPVAPTVEFTAATVSTSVSENAGAAVIELQISAGVGPASVDVTTVNGSATAESDFTSISNLTVSIPAGATAPVSIPIVNDTTPFEGNETFTVTITPTPGTNTLIGESATATVTIVDSTAPPVVEFSAASTAFTLNEDGNSPVLEIVVSSGNAPASVQLTTMDGTATAPGDYSTVNQTLIFDADTTSQTVTVPINTDTLVEPNESLTVVLTATPGSGTLIGENNSSTITIVDTTTPPTVEFADNSTSLTVDENAGSPTLTLNLTAGTAPASVNVTSVNGTAEAPDDFTAISQTVVFPAGSTTQSIPLSILTDNLLEDAESFTVVLASTPGTTTEVGPNNMATVTITDTTSPPTVEFDPNSIDLTVNEDGNSVSVELILSNGAAPASVLVSTADGSAIEGQDYTGVSQTITFSAGTTTQSVTIPLLADDIIEDAENFVVNLMATAGSTTQIGDNDQANITITDTSLIAASVQLTANSIDVSENAGQVEIELQRSGNAAITVAVNTVDNSATAPDDYTALSTSVSWAANESGNKVVSIPIVQDAVVDPGESFSVELSQPSGGIIGNQSSTQINIIDDSDVGLFVFTSTTIPTSETAGSITVQVERQGGLDGSVAVNFATDNGSATGGADFESSDGTLSWQSGEGGTKDITITLLDDNELEEQEEFFVQLSGSVPLGDDQQLGDVNRISVTIAEDSADVGQLQFVNASTDSVVESESMVTILVERVNGSEGFVVVDYETRDGSAIDGDDYAAQTGRLSWEPGETQRKSITITLLSDNIVEGNETFFVDLVRAIPVGSDVQIGDPASHVVTIVDDSIFEDDTNPTTESPFRVVATTESTRTHVGGQIAENLEFEITDTRTGDAQVPQLQVRWRAEPAGAVEFLEGEIRDDFAFTTTDENGRTSNSVRIVRTDGTVRVIAEALLADNSNANGPDGLSARNAIPDFSVPVGQGFYTLRIGIGELPSLSRNQDSVGDGLDAACDTLRLLGGAAGNPAVSGVDSGATNDLIATCEQLELQIENSQDPGRDLDRIAPEELFAIADSLISTADLQITNVFSRINTIRSGRSERLDLSGLNINLMGEDIPGTVVNAAQDALYEFSGGSASADDLTSERLGIFTTGSISVGTIDGGIDDGTGEQQSADVETSGITIGADYRISDSLAIGAGVNLARNETQFTTSVGGSKVESLGFTLFGTWYKSNFGYADVVLDVGQSSFDIQRQINLIADDDNEPVLAMGETDALVTSITVSAGRNFNMSGWEFGPYGRLSLTRASIDAYSERASRRSEGFGSVLNVSAHNATSTTISVGGQVSKAISTSKAVFVPQARFEYEAETEGSKEGISASFQADPSNSLFTITGNERDTGYFNLGIGASAQFTNGRSAQLFYETRAQQDNVTQHWLKFGFRLSFR